ncbi:MAG: hypothetical protein AAB399_01175 [Patescibacteria group bacterium]
MVITELEPRTLNLSDEEEEEETEAGESPLPSVEENDGFGADDDLIETPSEEEVF